MATFSSETYALKSRYILGILAKLDLNPEMLKELQGDEIQNILDERSTKLAVLDLDICIMLFMPVLQYIKTLESENIDEGLLTDIKIIRNAIAHFNEKVNDSEPNLEYIGDSVVFRSNKETVTFDDTHQFADFIIKVANKFTPLAAHKINTTKN